MPELAVLAEVGPSMKPVTLESDEAVVDKAFVPVVC